jgi:genome maintenance exonuclease 1
MNTTYIDGGRFYSAPNGELYPSVTTVTGWEKREFFAEWRKNNPEESKIATARGTAMHSLVESYINNEEDCCNNYFEDVVQLFNQMLPLLEKIDNVRSQEVPLWSSKLRMAGRVDCVAEYDGKLSIIDFKSSKSAKKAEWIEGYFAQATAYAIMWQEMTGEPIDQVVILVSSMDGTHQEFVRKSIDYVPRLKEMIDGYYSSSNAV